MKDRIKTSKKILIKKLNDVRKITFKYLFNLTKTLYNDKFFHDGVHYNELGHVVVSKKIVQILSNF